MTDQPASDDVVASPQRSHDDLRHLSSETPCPYLPGLAMRSEAYLVDELDGATHEHMMGLGFRRCGRVVYRPRCRSCRECIPIRVPVEGFRRSRSLRRVWARNADVRVTIGTPEATDEKFELFIRYLDGQHDMTMARTFETFRDFLYDSPTQTLELCFHLGQRLLGVSIVDGCPTGLSSVYMYFDPDHAARSPGTFSILWEIEHGRSQGLLYYYLGYHIAGSRTMDYKSRFRPHEVLMPGRGWVGATG